MRTRYAFGVFILIILLSIGVVYIAGGWENFKLKTVPYWGYLTFKNNPLLRGRDADLKSIAMADVKKPRIDISQLLPGGPPKDGIPAIDRPKFDTIKTTPFSLDEPVLGIEINGDARAYPYGILNWHEIVNDTVGGIPVSITYCPLCDTGITFQRIVNGLTTTFGVSGKLYQSCLVMYDRLTDTLWSQPWGIGIVGEETNTVLRRFPTYKTTLGRWFKLHPDSKILSTKTGHRRDYFRYPYGSYYTDNSLIFPVRNQDMIDGPLKEIFYIVWEPDSGTPNNRFSGYSQAFSLRDIRESGHINGSLGDVKIVAIFDKAIKGVKVFETPERVKAIKDGMVIFEEGSSEEIKNLKELPTTSSFAFVYPAFFR